MKYSYTWIQSHIEEKLPAPEVLREKIIFGAFEVESIEKRGTDSVFDVKVLPDRAGDCLSHYGMAREIAGLLGLTLKQTVHTLPSLQLLTPVTIETSAVRRYIAVRMDGVSVGASPSWLKEALESVGQRSINAIVDATNFVLLDSGQPTHAFDAAKIDGGIIVRKAKEQEKIITLSDEEKILNSEDAVVADYLGVLAIAGVKGGKSAEITSDTNSIILEIANFDPTAIRKTARRLGLPTDAVKRFENNLSPDVAYQAAAQLVALIKHIAGGEITGVSDTYSAPVIPRELSFTLSDLSRLLGEWVTDAYVKKVFDSYAYTYTFENGIYTFSIPHWRSDIEGVHNIAEEIGRVIGYEHIAPIAFSKPLERNDATVYQSIRAAKAWLVHAGYCEVMTYAFCAKGEIEVAQAVKGKNMLRTNLSDGLKESFELNKKNAPLLGFSEIKIFEIGTVFKKTGECIHVAYADAKGIVEMPLEDYITTQHIVAEHATIELQKTAHTFVPWSMYPFSTRDIAVWIFGGEEKKQSLAHIVSSFAKEYCVRDAQLFDEFTKDGKTSRAYRFVFQSDKKTLTESEIESWMEVLYERIRADESYTIR